MVFYYVIGNRKSQTRSFQDLFVSKEKFEYFRQVLLWYPNAIIAGLNVDIIVFLVFGM